MCVYTAIKLAPQANSDLKKQTSCCKFTQRIHHYTYTHIYSRMQAHSFIICMAVFVATTCKHTYSVAFYYVLIAAFITHARV